MKRPAIPPKVLSRAEFHAQASAHQDAPERVEASERYSSRHYIEQAAAHRRMRNISVVRDLSARRRA